MKKIIYIAFIALGLCACDNKDEFLNTLTPETTKSPVAYHFNLQASFDDQTRAVTFDGESTITTQFESTDKIYVYNETKGAFARSADGDHPLSYLQPTNISGSSCTLVGDLSFYLWDDNNDKWEVVTVDAADTYSLYYQMNDPDYNFPVVGNIPRFDYSQQDGSASAASNCDFAEATGITMNLSGNTFTVPNSICFSNLQSMFRQRLSFTKEGNPVTPSTITKLTIGTNNDTLIEYDRPDRPINPTYDGDTNIRFWTFSIDIDDPVITNGDIYLSLAFYYTNDNPAAGDQLILTATDDQGNVYQCAKDVPSGGFQKSKYYYGNCEMVWQYQQSQSVKPTVTRSDGGDEDELDPYNNGLFDITGDPAKVTISGNSTGYYFNFDGSAEVTLTGGGTANLDKDDVNFIYAEGDLTIVLGSDYTINCPNYDPSIYCKGNLKLKTTGNEQKLTVTTNEDEDSGYFGICGWTNYNNYTQTALSNLAFEGFTITRSAMTDNNDGTYTWVYTVTPNPHTLANVIAGDVGNVIGANGVIYANAAEATAAGTTAEAMIAFVGSVDGVCEHGLAISLTDFTQDNDPDPYTTFQLATSITAAEATTAISGGTWRLPTEKDWQYMIWGDYVENRDATDASGFISKLTTAGGSALIENSYWTNTSIDADNAKGLQYDGTYAGFNSLTKTHYWHVRACLSF